MRNVCVMKYLPLPHKHSSIVIELSSRPELPMPDVKLVVRIFSSEEMMFIIEICFQKTLASLSMADEALVEDFDAEFHHLEEFWPQQLQFQDLQQVVHYLYLCPMLRHFHQGLVLQVEEFGVPKE